MGVSVDELPLQAVQAASYPAPPGVGPGQQRSLFAVAELPNRLLMLTGRDQVPAVIPEW